MKALLITPRWQEYRALGPGSGRPFLDLVLLTLGFGPLDLMEVASDDPFDPNRIAPEYGLILVQAPPNSRRMRRAVLSRMGLSLGLDADDAQLRVVGARPLPGRTQSQAGFVVQRRGRIMIFCEEDIWTLRDHWCPAVEALVTGGEGVHRESSVRACWLVEAGGNHPACRELLPGREGRHCQRRRLPEGDTALLIPNRVSLEVLENWRTLLGDRLYAETPLPLEELVGIQLGALGLTVATAESCTAGWITGRLSAVSGSSAYLKAGFTVYHNDAKVDILGVSASDLTQFGAVSAPVARAMAQGAMERGRTDVAVSVTGIAGPGGGSPEKPVGTVFMAAVNQQGHALEQMARFSGNRDRIRFQASQTALHLLRRILKTARR
jgi:PncC family amidohydrolase